MNLPHITIQQRVTGCLIGGAIGDALAAPLEGMDYRDIREFIGEFAGFADLAGIFADLADRDRSGVRARLLVPPFHDLGTVTDDTVMADLLIDAILGCEGQLTAYDWATAWERFDEPIADPDGGSIVRLDRVHWIERIPFLRNKLQRIPKRELGHGEDNATNVIMFIAPVGLLCAGDPLLAELMAVDVGAVNQHGVPRDVGGGYAAMLAAAFLPDQRVDDLIELAIRHSRHRRSVKELRAMVDLARRCGETGSFTAAYYDEILGHLLPYRDEEHEERATCTSWNSSEVLGPVLGMLAITGGQDVAAMMLACARFGRDADTLCRVAGGLLGVLHGPQVFPEEWRRTILERNRWLRLEEKATALANIVKRNLAQRRDAVVAVLDG